MIKFQLQNSFMIFFPLYFLSEMANITKHLLFCLIKLIVDAFNVPS